ncbi:hypothetical protein BDW59DRAFT_167787 [Aspergillus cavernicola]|uniref:General substrate transporter n=1 Tax=Aspergillus cavernicola TaxID=176166 RepID=A0ABR4HAP9_9EURO
MAFGEENPGSQWAVRVLTGDNRYVGGLVAAGVTYTTSAMNSTSVWRVPVTLQGAFVLFVILLMPFIPESPRWLAFVGREHECRHLLALISSALLTVFMFLTGARTKLYGTSSNTSGVYATIAMIFLFQGSYSLGWTRLSMLYPPKVLSFRMRSWSGIYGVVTNLRGLIMVYAFLIALQAIWWKIYMVNGAWDVRQFLFVLFYWVETKGRSLEEIDDELDWIPISKYLEETLGVTVVITKKKDQKTAATLTPEETR